MTPSTMPGPIAATAAACQLLRKPHNEWTWEDLQMSEATQTVLRRVANTRHTREMAERLAGRHARAAHVLTREQRTARVPIRRRHTRRLLLEVAVGGGR